MNLLFFDDKNAPKKLDKKVVFEVPLSVIVYGSFICFGVILLLSVFLGLFTGGI